MKTALACALVISFAVVLVTKIRPTAKTPSYQSQGFTALGDLAGGTFVSIPSGISADGSVVIGYSNSDAGMEAFHWSWRGGIVGLGFPQAFAVSADGSSVVGFRHIAGATEPVRWTQHGGMQGFGIITGYEFGVAHGASADGSVIVGKCEPRTAGGAIAFRWTQGSGSTRLEPLPNAVLGAEAYALSSDGEVVVGAIQHEPGRCTAFRWTSKSGSIDLGTLPGDTESIANAVSADGSVVVGVSWLSGKAFRWAEETGMVDLGTLPGGVQSCAFGVSADGSIIVGQSNSANGTEAFIWDAAHGMRSLRQLLISEGNLGANLRTWKLRSATAVSADGSTVVGFGTNPSGNHEAWIARPGNKPLTAAPAPRAAVRIPGARST